MATYKYCGISIESSLDFPELERVSESNTQDIVQIKPATVKIRFDHTFSCGPNWAVGKNEAFWWLDGIVRFRVLKNELHVDACRDVSFGLIRALCLEAPMIIAMLYLESFCLNVSSISDGSTVKAFCMLPGGGSSAAVAWNFKKKGYLAFSDSNLRIQIDKTGRPMAYPQGSGVLLWPKIVQMLKLENWDSLLVREELPLRRLQLTFCRSVLPLKKIITASTYRFPEESIQKDLGATKNRKPFQLAARRTAGRLWVDAIGITEQHFLWCLGIAKHCSVVNGSAEEIYPL